MLMLGNRFAVLTATLLLLGSWLQPAGAQLLGPEFRVNSYTSNSQSAAAVAADPSGKFVVVWQSDLQNGALRGGGSLFLGVFGQRYTAAGAPSGGEFQVNTYTTGPQSYPAVAMDGLGNFDVVWASSGQDGSGDGVIGRRYNSAGSPLGGEFQVNTFTTGFQSFPAVAADGAGNFVVAWMSQAQDGSDSAIVARRYDSTGGPLGGEFQVNTYTTNSQSRPAVAATAAGSFVVVWMSGGGQDGSGDGVFGQRFNAAGIPQGSEFQVNVYTTGSQQGPTVAVDDTGNFVVVWTSSGGDGSNSGVFGRRYSPTGAAQGTQFQINTYTTENQGSPSVAADGAGNFLVTWDSRFQDGLDSAVVAQRFDAQGRTLGRELRVNTFTTGHQGGALVSKAGAGRFVVVWNSNGQDGSEGGVFGQRLPASVFFGDFDSAPPFWSATTATMCSGHCVAGGTPDGICFCDNLCLTFEDCCLDACATCGQCAP